MLDLDASHLNASAPRPPLLPPTHSQRAQQAARS